MSESDLELSVPDDGHVRRMWLQRCRVGASIPTYIIVNLRLNEVFEFKPDRGNRDFMFACREKPHGTSRSAAS
jgi:hypothetical protein